MITLAVNLIMEFVAITIIVHLIRVDDKHIMVLKTSLNHSHKSKYYKKMNYYVNKNIDSTQDSTHSLIELLLWSFVCVIIFYLLNMENWLFLAEVIDLIGLGIMWDIIKGYHFKLKKGL